MKEKLSFAVQTKASQRADHSNSVRQPEVCPCFVLVFNDDWNDYSYYTWFALWYFNSDGEKRFIGELKILNRDSENTFDIIPKTFDAPLSSDFCSLGISSRYYQKLITALGNKEKVYEVLKYLRDAAVDVRIKEEFDNLDGFKHSLLRDMSSEKAMKEARMIIEERGSEKAFSFAYRFKVPYNDKSECLWKVHIDYNPKKFSRIFGVIGENGVGKTSMLRNFVADFTSDESGGFRHKPLFNSLSVISSVSSDNYPQSKLDIGIPYNCYSLDQNRENYDTLLGAAERIVQSRALVNGVSKISIYYDVIRILIGSQADSMFVVIDKDDDGNGIGNPDSNNMKLDGESMRNLLPELSSGQLHILAMTTFLIADMHLSSLIIIDEPEVHLHPSSIVDFMILLFRILDRFHSYAIIATHSPLIVREMVNTNVYQFCRADENIPLVSRVAYDTFGEDISTLYCKIFGYDESQSIFSKVVSTLAQRKRKWNTDEIEKFLASELPMNLNARFRIYDIVNRVKGDA